MSKFPERRNRQTNGFLLDAGHLHTLLTSSEFWRVTQNLKMELSPMKD